MSDSEVGEQSGFSQSSLYGYVIVAAAFLVMLTGFGFYNSFGVFFKPLINEFGWTRALTSGAFALSNLVRGFLGILMGGINDRLGPRAVLTICGFLIGLGFLLMSQINSVWQLYLFYVVLIGIGMAGLFVPLLSTIARWFTKRRSMMTGIVTMGLSIGILISAPVANWLISLYQWRMSFVILGIIAFIVVVVAAQLLRRDPAQRQPSSSGDRDGIKQMGGLSLREAVHTDQFWIISCMMFCIGYSLMAIVVHIVPHALDLGFSTVSSANILAAVGGVSIVGNVLGGGISDRFGSRMAYMASFLVLAVAIFWLVPSRELWAFSIFAVIFGLGHGGGTPLQSPIVARVFGLKSHGMIFGTTNLMFAIGSSAGPFLTGYLFDVTGSYQIAFIICAGLSVVGMVLAATLRPLPGQEAKI